MCDCLETKNGAEIWSVGQLRDLYPDLVPANVEDERCLCSLDLEMILPEAPDQWRQGSGSWSAIFATWVEVEDGETWADGFTLTPDAEDPCLMHISRVDGREPMTFEEDLASRGSAVDR